MDADSKVIMLLAIGVVAFSTYFAISEIIYRLKRRKRAK